MAGNIIPAIATSNAIIASLVVLMAINVIRSRLESCQSVYLRKFPNPKGYTIVRENKILEPNPKCTVCSLHPHMGVAVDLNKMTIKEFEISVLKETLHMIQPDVQIEATARVLISSEEGELDGIKNKTLQEMGLCDSSILVVDDFFQNYTVRVVLHHRTTNKTDPPVVILGNLNELKPKDESTRVDDRRGTAGQYNNYDENHIEEDEDDDIIMLYKESDEEDESVESKRRGRKRGLNTLLPLKNKKRKKEIVENCPTIILDSDDDS